MSNFLSFKLSKDIILFIFSEQMQMEVNKIERTKFKRIDDKLTHALH